MQTRSLEISLLLIRLTLFAVILIWTIDKFVYPEHAAGIYAEFYGIAGLGVWPMYLLGAIELLILLAFVAGIARTASYGFVVVIHGVSTLSAFAHYLAPFTFPNLLFFAAWPMWAAAIALFLLRAHDRLLSVNR